MRFKPRIATAKGRGAANAGAPARSSYGGIAPDSILNTRSSFGSSLAPNAVMSNGQPVPTFSFAQPQPQTQSTTTTTPFGLGQSQSFPQTSAPSASSSNTPFSFGGFGSNNSFNFSAPAAPTVDQNANNMFGSNASTAPSQSGRFSGFQGSMFTVPSASSFVQDNGSSTPQATGSFSGFGHTPATSAPFGSSLTQSTSMPSNSGFGQPSEPSNNGFGQASETSNTGFGQSAGTFSTSFGQSSATSNNGFGQSSAPSNSNVFGSAPATSGTFAQSLFQTASTPSATSFGQTSTSTAAFAPSTTQTTAAPASNIFARRSATPPSFGQPNSRTITSDPSTSTFGQAPIKSTPFGQPSSQPSTSTLSSSISAPSPLFGGTISASQTSSAPSTSLFGQNNATQQSSSASSIPAFGQNRLTTSTPLSNLFGASSSSNNSLAKNDPTSSNVTAPASSMFGQASAANSPFGLTPTSALTSNAGFGQPSASASSSTIGQAATEPSSGLFGDFANSTGSVFQPRQSAKPQASTPQAQKPSTHAPTTSTAGQHDSSGRQDAPPPMSPSLSATTQPPTNSNPTPAQRPIFTVDPTHSSFSSTTSPPKATNPQASSSNPEPPMPSAAPNFAAKAQTTMPHPHITPPEPAASAALIPAQESGHVQHKFAPPPPTDFTEEQCQMYNEGFELRSINSFLKTRIKTLDPHTQDFDGLIRFYLAKRAQLGVSLKPIGPAVESVLGTKRKSSDDTESETGPERAKRAKTFQPSPLSQLPDTPTPASTNTAPKAVTGGMLSQSAAPLSGANHISTSAESTSPKKNNKRRAETDDVEDEQRSKRQRSAEPEVEETVNEGSHTSNLFKSLLETPNGTSSVVAADSSVIGANNASSAAGANLSGGFRPFLEDAAPTSNHEGAMTPSASTPFTFTPTTSSTFGAMNASIPSSQPAAKPALQVPKFGGDSAAPVDFLAQYMKKSEARAKAERKAAEYDSDEETYEEWSKRDDANQLEKKMKIEASRKQVQFVPGRGFELPQAEPEVEEGFVPPAFTHPTPSHSQQTTSGQESANNHRSGATIDSPQPSSLQPPLNHNFFAHLSDQESPLDSKTGDADDEGDSASDRDDLPDYESDHDDRHQEDEEYDSEGRQLSDEGSYHGNGEAHGSDPESERETGEPQSPGSSSSDPDSLFIKDRRRKAKGKAPSRVPEQHEPSPRSPAVSPDRSSASDGDDDQQSSQPLGRSLFDRITKDKNGTPVRALIEQNNKQNNKRKTSPNLEEMDSDASYVIRRNGEQPEERAPKRHAFDFAAAKHPDFSKWKKPEATTEESNSLDATRQSTSSFQPASQNGGFGNMSQSAGDHTWHPGTPIMFGTPAVNVTSPSPTNTPITNGKSGAPGAQPQPSLFGASSGSSTPRSNFFGSSTPTTTHHQALSHSGNIGFNFGGPPANAALHILHAGGETVLSSRANSPGITTDDGDDSGADPDVIAKHEQIDLTRGAGEENDQELFIVKAKAQVFSKEEKKWEKRGMGYLRVLKNMQSGEVRILMRIDPSGKVLINTKAQKEFSYEHVQLKTVKMTIAAARGLEMWIISVGDDQSAAQLASLLEQVKS